MSECKIHPGQRCEVFCHDCQTPVCVMCCKGPYQEHHAIEMNKIIKIIKIRNSKWYRWNWIQTNSKVSRADTYIKNEITKATLCKVKERTGVSKKPMASRSGQYFLHVWFDDSYNEK